MSNEITSVQMVANTLNTQGTGKGKGSTWFEVMAEAWGEALDAQAARIESQSLEVGEGLNSPAQINRLTTESLKMGFLSNSSHTAITSVGSALETLARKQ